MTTGKILKYYLLWQLAILVITALSAFVLPLRQNYLGVGIQTYQSNPLLYSRANFDGNHYLSIAKNGYGYAQQAFFPMYPNLIKKLSAFINSPVIAGLLISNISFLIALVFLNKLLLLDNTKEVSRWTILLLLIFPTSFFFGAVYTEGLFFLLLISSFYFARTGKWWLAVLCGGLAAYTKFIGIFIFPALLVEWWLVHQDIKNLKSSIWRKKIKNLIPIFIIPMGLVVYMLFLNRTVSDPIAFFHAQKLFGQARSEKIILLYQVFWRYAKMIATVDRSNPIYLNVLLETFTGIIFLTTSIYSFLKHRLSYSLFNFATYIVPTLTGNFVSLPRYVLICFPSFIILAQAISKTGIKTRKILLLSSAIIFSLFLGLFARGNWVA